MLQELFRNVKIKMLVSVLCPGCWAGWPGQRMPQLPGSSVATYKGKLPTPAMPLQVLGELARHPHGARFRRLSQELEEHAAALHGPMVWKMRQWFAEPGARGRRAGGAVWAPSFACTTPAWQAASVAGQLAQPMPLSGFCCLQGSRSSTIPWRGCSPTSSPPLSAARRPPARWASCTACTGRRSR